MRPSNAVLTDNKAPTQRQMFRNTGSGEILGQRSPINSKYKLHLAPMAYFVVQRPSGPKSGGKKYIGMIINGLIYSL